MLLAIACAVAVVAFALRGVPRRVGVVRAAAGVVTLVAVGDGWVRLMSLVVPRLRPGIYLEIIIALSFYLAPTAIALAVVGLIARGGRDRMSA